MVERSELVPCWATSRLSELAPHSEKAFCVDALHAHAGEWRQAGLRRGVDAEPVAGFGLAEELVGAGAAVGGARLQVGDDDLALQLVGRPGVTRQRIDVEAGLGERGVGRDADAVAPALAHEAVGPLSAVRVAHAQPDQEARVEAVVETGRGAARVVGEASRHCRLPCTEPRPPNCAQPGAPGSRPRAGLDVAGLRPTPGAGRCRRTAARQRTSAGRPCP